MMRLISKDELEGALDYDAVMRLEREGWWVVQGPADTVRLEKSRLLETREGLVLVGVLNGEFMQFKVLATEYDDSNRVLEQGAEVRVRNAWALADLEGHPLEVTLEGGYVVDARGG